MNRSRTRCRRNTARPCHTDNRTFHCKFGPDCSIRGRHHHYAQLAQRYRFRPFPADCTMSNPYRRSHCSKRRQNRPRSSNWHSWRKADQARVCKPHCRRTRRSVPSKLPRDNYRLRRKIWVYTCQAAAVHCTPCTSPYMLHCNICCRRSSQRRIPSSACR